jgi:NAD(P)-dependent dehydrogenase (short-subunit alcohol dehydrogenase family)
MPVLPPFRSAGDSHPSSALVTGARRGIGKAIALALARRGLDVAVLDRVVTGELRAVAGDIRSLGRRSVAISADIARIEGHPAAIDEAEAAVGPLDYLVNVAGVSVQARGDLLDVTPESYDHCLDINTRGTFFLMQAFARRAVARPAATGRRCAIVTITSSNAVAASITRGEYCISKAALSMACTLFALRLAGQGIEVYEVQPGLIATEMTAPSKPRYDRMIEEGLTAIPRWGLPEDVAGVVATLVFEGLPYTVGQPIRVDGGLLIRKF